MRSIAQPGPAASDLQKRDAAHGGPAIDAALLAVVDGPGGFAGKPVEQGGQIGGIDELVPLVAEEAGLLADDVVLQVGAGEHVAGAVDHGYAQAEGGGFPKGRAPSQF